MTTKNRNLRLLGKGVMGLLSRAEVTATLSILSLALPAMAGPDGEQVVRGDVRFERRGNETWITAGRNSIINYRTFNIASNETVRFIQPDANSRVLNRVTTAAPTRIDGSLFANGRVYIVNPAGVYFGQNAVVDVNGLTAAAGNITDTAFLRGVDRFTNMRGAVTNEGLIRANVVALVGRQVTNAGTIVAPQGTIVLAAGDDVVIGQQGTNVVVRVPRSAGQTSVGVTNTGNLDATGGQVSMMACDVLGATMTNSGRIAANDVRIEAKSGSVNVSGEINASSDTHAGGTVRVLGEHVTLNNATIDASGTTGGTIMVGGNFYGQGPEARSQTTNVDAGSTLRADGTAGDAGRVVAWSDGTTMFDGVIVARALGNTGKGGIAEVSGKQHVSIGGHAYLHGKTGSGTFTIDPGSVSIVDGANTAPGGALDTFNDGWIIDQMENGGADLTISTANSTNAGTEDLTVDAAAALTYNSTHTLNLVGANSVTVDGTITNAGTGGLSLSGGSVAVNGAVDLGGDFASSGSTFANAGTIEADSMTLTHTGAVDINANVTVADAFVSNNSGIGGTFDSSGFQITAGAGGATINHAGDAVTVNDVTATGGAIELTGANIFQIGDIIGQSFTGTATGAFSLTDTVTVEDSVTISGTSFVSNVAGEVEALGGGGGGSISITATAGNIAISGELSSGTGGIDILASAGTVQHSAVISTTGAYTGTSSSTFTLSSHLQGDSITIHGGTGGTGNVVMGGFAVRSDTISVRAGSGSGTTSSVDVSGLPTFMNFAGTARPDDLTIRQDASIADAGISNLNQFQGLSIAGMNYTLQSDGGSITNSTANKFANSNLTLLGDTGVSLLADLSLASLEVTGATTLSANLSTGTGAMTFNDAVALGAANRSLTGGAITLDGGATSTGGGLQVINSGTFTVGGDVALTGAGVFNQSGTGAVVLEAGVATQNQNISFAGAITVDENATVNAGTATIALADDVDLTDNTLTLTGDEIDLNGGAGTVTGTGGSIVLQPSAAGVTIGVGGAAGTLDLSAVDIAALGTGIDSVTIGRSGGTHDITIDASTFTSATTFRGGAIAVNGQLTGTGSGSFDLQGTTTLNEDIVTDSQDITITGDLILGAGQTDYTLDTTDNNNSTGADITVTGTTNSVVAGDHGLALRAGVGDIAMGNIGDTDAIDFVRVVNAADATFGSVVADYVLQLAGTGLSTFGDITASEAVNLVGNEFSFQDANVTGGFGFRVQNAGEATFAGDLTLEGRLLQSGAGAVNLGGDITTTNDPIDFAGAVTLTGDVVLTAGNGNVAFTSTLDGAHDLTVTTTNGSVTFTGAVGSTAALDVLTTTTRGATFSSSAEAGTIDVTSAADVSIGGDLTASTITLRGGSDGTGNLLFTNSGISLSGDDITLAVGDATPGGTATLNLATNTPTFRGLAGGSTSPDSVTLIQDASFTAADLPDGSSFAGGLFGLDYTITSRDGSVTIADADKVNGTNLTVDGGLGVTLSESLNLESFTTDSDTSLTGDIQTSGDLTINGTLTLVGSDGRLNSGFNTTTLSDVVAGNFDFAVTANSLVLNGSLTGTGTLILQPGTASRDVRLGGASEAGAFFELNQAEIGGIADGWGEIYIGRRDGTGLMFFDGDTTFLDPTIFRMNGATGRIDVYEAIRGDGNASLRFFSGGNTTLYDNVVTAGNFIEFGGPVVLQVDALVDSTNNGANAAGADISFRDLIDSAPSTLNSLTVNAGTSGVARLEQEVGLFNHLESLTITGEALQIGKVTTTNAQSYTGAAYVGGDITSTVSGSISFSERVFLTADSDIATAGGASDSISFGGGIDSFSSTSLRHLTIDAGAAAVTIGGLSGQNTKLASFEATGATINSGGVRSLGNVTYDGVTTLNTARVEGVNVLFEDDVTLNGNATVVATSSASFGGFVESEAALASNLTVNSPVTTFGGSVGDTLTRELGTLSTSGATNISGGAIRATNALSFGGTVQLNTDVTFAADTGGIEFLDGLNSDDSSTPRSIILNSSGEIVLAGPIGDSFRLASITTGGGGIIRVAASQIRTTATQDYATAVIVDANTVFSGTNISFASTIDSGSSGPRSVTVTATGGTVTFSGAVGADEALSQFNVSATSFTLPSVRTTGSQTYTGITTLTGDLLSTAAGAISFSGVTKLDADVAVTTAGGATDNVSFASAVDSRLSSHALTVSAGQGAVTFGSNVGFGTGTDDRQLSAFTVNGGTIAVQGVQTSGSQYLGGTTTLRGNLTSTVNGSITLEGAAILSTNLVLTTASGGIFVDATVNSDSTTRSLNLSSGGSSVKRLGGAIGATAQLSTITVNSDGSTTLSAPTIKTSGNQTYSGPVNLANNVTIQSPAAVTFIGTIDSATVASARTLVIDSTGGTGTTSTVTFSGDIGSNNPLGKIQTAGPGTARLGGNIKAEVDFFGAVKLLNSITIDANRGNSISGVLTFRGTVDTETGLAPANLTLLSSRTDTTPDRAPFRFSKSIGSINPIANLTIGADLATPFAAASIAFTDSFDTTGRILASGVNANTDTFTIKTSGNFLMGQGHKLTAFGSLIIQAGGSATLGDLTSLNTITVTSNNIILRARQPRAIFDNIFETPDQYPMDQGVDYVAAGGFIFSSRPTVTGSGNAPIFASNTGTVNNNLDGFAFRRYTGGVRTSDFTDTRSGGSNFLLPLDLRAFGASSADLATSLASALPKDSTPGVVVSPPPVSDSIRSSLADMGIQTRDLTPEETIAFLAGNSTIDNTSPGTGLIAGDLRIASNRVTGPAAQSAIRAYQALVYKPDLDANGKPLLDASGKPVLKDRTADIKATLARAWESYATKAVNPSGAGFRAFLENRAGQATTTEVQALRDLDAARDAITSIRAIGLSEYEASIPRRKIIAMIRPDSVSEQQLIDAIFGAPVRN